jgi:hypothetical protein
MGQTATPVPFTEREFSDPDVIETANRHFENTLPFDGQSVSQTDQKTIDLPTRK